MTPHLVYKQGCRESARIKEAVERSSIGHVMGFWDIDRHAANRLRFYNDKAVYERYKDPPILVVHPDTAPNNQGRVCKEGPFETVQLRGPDMYEWLAQYDADNRYSVPGYTWLKVHKYKQEVPGRNNEPHASFCDVQSG